MQTEEVMEKSRLQRLLKYHSNTGIVKAIHEKFSKDPRRFVDRLTRMHLDKQLDLPIVGEGKPYIPHPDRRKYWSGISLEWMAFGYGLHLTPLQSLTFYNAIANDGEMVKPRLIKEVREWDKTIVKYEKEVIDPQICSQETVDKVKHLLRNVIEGEKGTGRKLYSPNFHGWKNRNYSKKL